MLKELKAQHRNIIQLAFNGFSRQEIAEQLDIHVQTITNVLTSPLGKAYLDGLSDKVKEVTIDVRRELVSMNKDALKTLKTLLDPKGKIPASVKLGAVKDVLDRTGYKPTDKIDIDMTYKTKTDEELDAEIAAIEESIASTQTAPDEEPIKFIPCNESENGIKQIEDPITVGVNE
jgi:hypothetical protein